MTEENQVSIERTRIWYNFWKFVSGTGLIGVVSVIINGQIQNKKLDFEIGSKESEFIGQFLQHALDKELEKRRDFAEYFRKLSPTEDARKRWENYLGVVTNMISEAGEKEKELEEKRKQLTEIQARLARAEAEAQAAQKKVVELSAATEGPAGKQPELEKVRVNLTNAASEAQNYRDNLEQLQKEIFLHRKQIASIRSEPLEVQVPLNIKANNIATKSKDQEGFWDWTVFVEGPERDLDQIESVEYTLHPTFPDPVRLVSTRGVGPRAFPLNTSGWGTFAIKIRVFLKNGQVQLLTHYLSFPEKEG